MGSITEFLERFSDSFNFAEIPNSHRKQLIDRVIALLSDETVATTETLQALDVVRILSRDKSSLEDLVEDSVLTYLLNKTSLGEDNSSILYENVNTDIIISSVKCFCNLVFNSRQAEQFCVVNICDKLLLLRSEIYEIQSISQQMRFYDMRLLFIITARSIESRRKCLLEYNSLKILNTLLQNYQVEQLTDDQCDVVCEILKLLFNITHTLHDEHNLDEHFNNLTSTLNQLINTRCESTEKHWDIVKHSMNLVSNIPPKHIFIFTPPVQTDTVTNGAPNTTSDVMTFEEHSVTSISIMLEYLRRCLDGPANSSIVENVLPCLSTLTRMSQTSRIVRRYCRTQVLPPLTDEVMRLPEQGEGLRNKITKLFTHINSQVKSMAAEYLFTLCKENVSRLIKYSGFGNAAGLLAHRGLLGGQMASHTEYSDDSDSDTEEYRELQSNVNPVTGRFEEARPDPMANMTDEQKEYEAVQLLNAMDRLQRLGVVQPSRIGADGRPEAVEHVLQILEQPDPSNSNSDNTPGDD